MSKTKTGIFIGIPRSREYVPFAESLFLFIEKCKKKYDIEKFEVWGKYRDEAREEIVKTFLSSTKDYLLFLDDDHEGHTIEMLDDLLNSDAQICSLKCYARYYPYQITTISKNPKFWDNHSTILINKEKGYDECDFVGFGMTIIKRELFSKCLPPYFKCNNIKEEEDKYFCQKLKESNIPILGCFNHVLSHCGINDETVIDYRVKGYKKFIRDQQMRTVIKNFKEYMKKNKVDEKEKAKIDYLDMVYNKDDFIVNAYSE